MDPQLFAMLTARLDAQDDALQAINTKLDHMNGVKNSITWLKWIVGGAWAGLLALFSFQKH